MTTGMDWIGKRIDEISAESRGLGRTQERGAVIAYLNNFVANFEHKPVINVRQLIAQIAIDLGDGKHLVESQDRTETGTELPQEENK
jgi:hypothetical protein